MQKTQANLILFQLGSRRPLSPTHKLCQKFEEIRSIAACYIPDLIAAVAVIAEHCVVVPSAMDQKLSSTMVNVVLCYYSSWNTDWKDAVVPLDHNDHFAASCRTDSYH